VSVTTSTSKPIAARLRALCLALPETAEVAMKRGPSYRVADKIFALERAHGEGVALWCKVPHGSQQILIGADSKRFFVPPYFGAKGWIGVVLDRAVDWREVEAFVGRSYSLVAPKRLAAPAPSRKA
jgi:predicted DNA-binding protein (MmcQ/YjbR family)